MAESHLSDRMRFAIGLLRSVDDPWAAVTMTQSTRLIQPFGHGPRSAFVNLRTARALEGLGLVEFSGGGVEPLYEYVRLTGAGESVAL